MQMLSSRGPSTTERRTATQREFATGDGRRLRLEAFFDTGDPEYAELTEKVVHGRLREYRRHALLPPEARPDNVRGVHVEFVVVVDIRTDEPVASLRKVHTTGGVLDAMPSFHRFAEDGAWADYGKQLLRARSAGDRPVAEIAALWKEHGLETGVVIELYKSVIQSSYRRGELLFMAVHDVEYDRLLRDFGARVVHTLGEPVTVQGDEFASGVRIRPVMIDPATFYDDLIAEIVDARTKPTPDLQEAALRGMLLQDFLIGLDPSLLGAYTRSRLDQVNNGILPASP